MPAVTTLKGRADIVATANTFLVLARAPQSDWIKPMEEARSRRDWARMVEICQRAVDAGGSDEYLLRSLSWAHRQLNQTAESWEIAQRNWRINPSIWSLINYIEAARDHGEYAEAVKAAIHLRDNKRYWGNLAKVCEDVIESVSAHTYEISWRIVSRTGKEDVRLVPIPQQDGNVQNRVSVNVRGAMSWSIETTREGVKYVKATVLPSSETWVTATVTMRPYSWRPLLSKVTSAKAPDELAGYLGKSDYYGQRDVIDPTAPLAKKLADELKGATYAQTAENVINYITKNIPWRDIPQNGSLTSEGCLQLKMGSCTPRTFAAVAILRAAGIPARAIRGHSGIAPNIIHPGPHTIPEFFLPGLGWVDSDFGRPVWTPRTNFLRMYIRVGTDQILGDAMDPTKDCFVKHLGSSL